MAIHTTPEEIKILKMIERGSFSDEEKEKWKESIQNHGLTEELVEEIRTALQTFQPPEDQEMRKMKDEAEFTRLVRSWRLNQSLRTFEKRGRHS